MNNILNLYFPAIRPLEDIASDIQGDENARKIFNRWSPEKRMHFVDICTGRKGVRMLYEPFLKEMLGDSFVRGAAEAYLSALTGQDVTIVEFSADLPWGMILMECVVALQNTGELRRIRFSREAAFLEKRKNGGSRENAYTVIVLDNSPDELKLCREEYMYYGCGQNNDDAGDEYLGEYCVFCQDRFTAHIEKGGIKNMMDAWWVFLVCDQPDILAQLIIKYPVFQKLYEALYHLLRDTGRTIQLMQGNPPHTDCGKKCGFLLKTEQALEEQKKQNAVQAEKMDKMQGTIDKQAYIISQQCSENAGTLRREKADQNRNRKTRHKNNRKKYKRGKKTVR